MRLNSVEIKLGGDTLPHPTAWGPLLPPFRTGWGQWGMGVGFRSRLQNNSTPLLFLRQRVKCMMGIVKMIVSRDNLGFIFILTCIFVHRHTHTSAHIYIYIQ